MNTLRAEIWLGKILLPKGSPSLQPFMIACLSSIERILCIHIVDPV